jgi:selenide, water dikinase
MEEIKLTKYSHGAGCGCKISPKILDQILHSNFTLPDDQHLLVGNDVKDDAAVYAIDDQRAIISTTDFFMPIVDDPYNFGRIASANAISDVYAMGGDPIMAIAILGWPINVLSPEIAKRVIEGSKSICLEAGIPLAGGHSIDSPEPIFGLAVNGMVEIQNLKKNSTAQEGDLLYLTKKIGVGILTTAEKKGILEASELALAAEQMMKLNKIGSILGKHSFVHAMTDVTGFGLLGHLTEMAEGSKLGAVINYNKVKQITHKLEQYIQQGSIPGGTVRNWDSYGHKIALPNSAYQDLIKTILSDPQTSGGLLVAIDPTAATEMKSILMQHGLEEFIEPIGKMTVIENYAVKVTVS